MLPISDLHYVPTMNTKSARCRFGLAPLELTLALPILLFVMALRAAKVPVEFHLFEKGQHGLGLGHGARQFGIGPNQAFQEWPKLCAIWLKGQGFLDRPSDRASRANP